MLLVRPMEPPALVLEQLHVVAEGRAACAVSLKCGGVVPREGPGAAAAAAATVTEETAAGSVAAGAAAVGGGASGGDNVPGGPRSQRFPTCMMWRVKAQSACVAVSCACVCSPAHNASYAQSPVCVYADVGRAGGGAVGAVRTGGLAHWADGTCAGQGDHDTMLVQRRQRHSGGCPLPVVLAGV